MFCFSDNKEKYAYVYPVLNDWLRLKIEEKEIKEFFIRNHINKIAVYGVGDLGEIFYSDIKNKGIEISYFVDQRWQQYPDGIDGIPVIGLNDIGKQKAVDAIIVAPVFYFNSIVDALVEAGCDLEQIISLSSVIKESR